MGHRWIVWKMPLCKSHTFWMVPCLVCCFIVILFYIKRKWLFMRNFATILPLQLKLSGNFHRFNAIDGNIKMLKYSWVSKTSVKMKSFKTFYENQIANRLEEIITLPPTRTKKSFLHLENKRFLTEICRNIQIFAFPALWECSSWASRNGAV